MTATYRLQLGPQFTFAEAAEQIDYLAELGVSHLYLSPVLAAAPGSTHGYDVVDHSRISEVLGGADGLAALAAAAHRAGLGLVVDVVPNHMALPTPARLNTPLWSVLRDGPGSRYARWFDVDWSVPDRAMLMPLLGDRIGTCLAAGQISLDRDGDIGEPVIRYYEHVLPVRPGTESLPLDTLLDRQWYRLAYWRVADEELNYRRFFDIDTLAALRVELPEVFSESHAVLAGLVRDGTIDGLRVDHPDGLADPRGYLTRLHEHTGGCWVVVEKILTGSESLPGDWPCAGTTGYDALRRVGGLFIDPDAAPALGDVYAELTRTEPEQPIETFDEVERASKRQVLSESLYAEVNRLAALAAEICHDDIMLRDHTRRGIEECLIELLVAFAVYRAYVLPGHPADPRAQAEVDAAAERARASLPDERHATLEVVRELALGRLGRDARLDEFVVRFQQTTGPVMAKGVEDTAFYRWFRLSSANEVGGDPPHLGVTAEDFHGYCRGLAEAWPMTMTTLSTHDTKRGEDVRARLGVLAQIPAEWLRAVQAWRAVATSYHTGERGWPDPTTEYLIWQTLVGAWPISAERMTAFVHKATREAKLHTSWTAPDADYDAAVQAFVEQVIADDALRAGIEAFVARIGPHARANVLGQKLVQLTMPGVPDVYQGTEAEHLPLVDPDNRRPVDYAARRRRLAAIHDSAAGSGGPPPGGPGSRPPGRSAEDLDTEKMRIVAGALRLRRAHPEWFGADAGYHAVETSSRHAVAFCRAGRVVTVASRFTADLERDGGWGQSWLSLPGGRWRDVLTDRELTGAQPTGRVPLGEVLDGLPVALLVGPD